MSRRARISFLTLVTLLQIALFGALFLVGGYWAEIRLGIEMRALLRHATPPPLIPLWKLHISSSLDYVANGFVFASVLLGLILLTEVLRKRLRPWALLSLLAFLLAFVISLVVHSGFVPLSNS